MIRAILSAPAPIQALAAFAVLCWLGAACVVLFGRWRA